MQYLTFNDAMRARFGTKVYRLSLQSGCTCPNRDGTLGTGGCTFCSEGGSGDFAAPLLPIGEQIEEAKRCPYELDTPELLRKNLADYKRILAGEVSV